MLRPVLGALEVKAIGRLVALHPHEWKPLHTAVLGCLLAHRNRRTGSCFPERRLLAAYCSVTERTIDRTLAQLTAWGAIEREQPRALTSQQFREAQYTFLFVLPKVLKTCETNCENPPSRATFSAEPCDISEGAVRHFRGGNKEEEKDLEAKEQSTKGEAPPPPKFTQHDFDERDWRKLNREIATIREAGIGGGGNRDGPDNFSIACQRAGISVRRGHELWRNMMEEETG